MADTVSFLQRVWRCGRVSVLHYTPTIPRVSVSANTPAVLCVSVCFSGGLVFRLSLVENGATYSRSDNGIRRTPQKEFLRAQVFVRTCDAEG